MHGQNKLTHKEWLATTRKGGSTEVNYDLKKQQHGDHGSGSCGGRGDRINITAYQDRDFNGG